jgi:hypothetical protein
MEIRQNYSFNVIAAVTIQLKNVNTIIGNKRDYEKL